MESKKVIFGAVALVFVTVAVLFGGWAGSNLRSSFLIDGTDYSTLSIDEFTAWLPSISNSDLTAVINGLSEQAETYNRSITKIYEEIGNTDKSITQGEERMKTIESEIVEREEAYRAANASYETLTNELTTLKAEAQSQTDIITGLTTENAEAERKLAELTAEKTQTENNLATAEKEFSDLQLGHSALWTLALVTLPAQILTANADLAQVTNEIVAKNMNIKRLEEKLPPLQKLRDDAAKYLSDLEKQKKDLTTQKSTLETQLKKENDILKTIKPASNSNPAYKKQREKVAIITKQINDVVSLLDVKNKNGIPEKTKVATTNRDTNKKAVETAEKTIKDAKQVVKNLEPLKETRGQAVKNLNEQKESTTRQYNQDTQKMRQLEKDITVLENTIKTFAPGLLSAEKAIADATGKVAAAQSALDAMNTAIIEKDVKIVEAKAVVDEKEWLLVEIKTEMRHLPGEAERLQEYKTWLSVQLEEAKMALSIVNEKAIRAQTEKTNNPLRQSNEGIVDNGGGTTGGWGTSTTTGGISDITLTTTTTTGGTDFDGTTGTTTGGTGGTTGGSGWSVCGATCNSCTNGAQWFPDEATTTESTCGFVCLTWGRTGEMCLACKSGYQKNDQGVCEKPVCGNKKLEEGEECDEGNTLSKTCDTSCNLITQCDIANSSYNRDVGKCQCDEGYLAQYSDVNTISACIHELPSQCAIVSFLPGPALSSSYSRTEMSQIPGCMNAQWWINGVNQPDITPRPGNHEWKCGSNACNGTCEDKDSSDNSGKILNCTLN
jgi:archaellum component FlaC